MHRIRKALDLARLEPKRDAPSIWHNRDTRTEIGSALETSGDPGDSDPLLDLRILDGTVHTATVDDTGADTGTTVDETGAGVVDTGTTVRESAAVPPSTRSLTSIVYSRSKIFTPPAEDLERNRIMNSGSANQVSAAYRMLRTQVLQRMDAHGWRSLAIFSPGSDDGKTTTAINLAVSLAHDQAHTVLLVDFDFKRPQLAACLGLAPQFGSDDALTDRARLEDCLYHPEGFDRLLVLPARGSIDNSSEILSGPRSRKVVAELRARYAERMIIFDLPPVLSADDALSFAPLVDCGLVIAAEGRTRRDDLVRTVELLHKTPLVGTVLNRASTAPAGY